MCRSRGRSPSSPGIGSSRRRGRRKVEGEVKGEKRADESLESEKEERKGRERGRELPQEAQQCEAEERALSLPPRASSSHLSDCPWGNSRVRAGNQPVQIIILLPCLIDARYFGLVLMTAFTEFMSSCRARGNFSLFLSFSPSVFCPPFSPPLACPPPSRYLSPHYLARNYLRLSFCLAEEERPRIASPSLFG